MRARLRTAVPGVVASLATGFALAAGFAPEKGETLYVAASLKDVHHRAVSGAKMTYDLAACEKLVVRKADARKRAWTVVDLMGNDVRLEGTWQPWMFGTRDECRDAIAKHGEAPVKKSGEVFTVSTPPPAPAT